MSKESISFRRIYNLAWRRLKEKGEIEEFKERLESAMAGYKEILTIIPVTIRRKGTEVTVTDIIDIWFNGHIFHSDIEKAKSFKAFEVHPFGPMAHHIFHGKIFDLANLMVYFANLIRDAGLVQGR